MPFRETHIVEQRIYFVIEAEQHTRSFKQLCRDYGISRQTGYMWLRRWQEEGSVVALQDRSRRPKTISNQTDPSIVARVIELRKQHGWGAKKLYVLLLQEGVTVSISTINRILKREGLLRRRDAHQPAEKRFEREHPNDLWQIDFKGWFRIADGKCYPLSIIDDHSRFAVALAPQVSIAAQPTYEVIVKAMKKYGVPVAMLMDHGTPWWSTNSNIGITWPIVQIMKQGVRIYHSGYRHPQTQGKVEAFHRTIGRDFEHRGGVPGTLDEAVIYFADFVATYNNIRPHEGIGMVCPATRYQPSTKAYDPDPPPYAYPVEYAQVRVDTEGSIAYKGRRHFVAKPFATEIVGVIDVLGKRLVRYRDIWVREVDLDTGKTRGFSKPVHDDKYLH